MNDMDAQNAAEPDQTKPTAASPHRRRASQADLKAASSSSIPKNEKSKPVTDSLPDPRPDDATQADRDSDAETIVLPGKDGHSPSKVRKVRQEDKSDSEGDDASKRRERRRADMLHHDADDRSGESARKKKRLSGSISRAERDASSRRKESGSSGLSSAPESPHRRRLQRRRSDAVQPRSSSDSDDSVGQMKGSHLDRAKSERLDKRKMPKIESDDDADNRRARRQRMASAGLESARKSSARSQYDRNQSNSPPPRHHRRSASTQLSSYSSNGLAQKKKRVPPPLQSIDYQSDDSSASGSPHLRNAKLRSLTTPSNTESNMSPAKVGIHKKHLDAHGQTLLARACARGEYDGVKTRLLERPEDLNVADYAGNTPLQIAAINGCEDIVKLLIDAGCNLDCVNYDKETPLLDAVDNDHLGVVKLLLDAGVNPRKANVNGEEPIDRVTDDMDNAKEIRAALTDAKKRGAGDRHRTSEDRHSHADNDGRDSHAPDSPRRSPAASSLAGRRGGTVRSTKTRNDLLYMPLDDKTLRQAAGRGDEETVARILQVKEGFDDPESMVAAARGGHDLVIQLLLGLGGANADPAPVSSLPGEFATPILAAIGQENMKVVELLLEQQGFDATRRFKGETYYEIARRRQGTNWKEEEHLLKNAYDEYKRAKKDSTNKSPSKRDRDRAREEKRSRREDAKSEARHARDGETSRKGLSKLDGASSKRRSDSFSALGDEESRKRAASRVKRDEKGAADREGSPRASQKSSKSKRTESDAGNSSDNDSAKPRRKLVSKGELSRERERHKRDDSDKPKLSEKYHDRAKALKRDESKDNDGSSKRHRNSITPDRPSDADKDEGEAPMKKRRLDGDPSDKKSKQRSASNDTASKSGATKGKDTDDHRSGNGEKRRSNSGDNVQIKSEDVDVAMPDATPLAGSAISKRESVDENDESLSNINKAEAEAKKDKATEDLEAKKKREKEERLRQEKEEAERKKREVEEAEKRKQEEEERKKREEEERIRREELAKEAEEARRLQEEEDRKERERREKAHREEMERKRAAREAEARRLREEQERARLDRLPPLLQWLQLCPNPKNTVVAEKLRFMPGLRYDTIRQAANGSPEGRELWLLNVQVALLLGEKDTDLSRYTAWERVAVTPLAKASLWRTEWPRWSLLDEKLWELGRQIPGYYGEEDAASLAFESKKRLKTAAWDRFLATDMFFVKLSDFLYTVPNIPHLRNLELGIEYRELAEAEADLTSLTGGQKWRRDPGAERFAGHAPRYRYFVNGTQVREDLPIVSQVSSKPFPEKRVPRRGGLIAVVPGEPDYERLAREQGLEHLLQTSPGNGQLPNGLHSSSPAQPLANGTNGHGASNNGLNGSPA